MGESVDVNVCVPRIFMFCLRGRTNVSSCRCCMGVEFVQPVAIRRAVF